MYEIIKHSHSGLMWLIVTMFIISLVVSIVAMLKKTETDTPFLKSVFLVNKWMVYIQFLMGLFLLWQSSKVHYESGFMKSDTLRFYGMEHPLMMIIATGLMAIGLFFAKRKKTSVKKNRTIVIYYTLALGIILMMVPWDAVFKG